MIFKLVYRKEQLQILSVRRQNCKYLLKSLELSHIIYYDSSWHLKSGLTEPLISPTHHQWGSQMVRPTHEKTESLGRNPNNV